MTVPFIFLIGASMFHVPFPKKSVLALSIASAIICMSNTTFAETIENAIYEDSNTLANNELIFTKAETNRNPGDNEYKNVAQFIKGGSLSIEADTVTFNAANKSTHDSSQTLGTGHNMLVITDGGDVTLNTKELFLGNQEMGGDRGFRLTGDGNQLTIHADKIVSYTGDEFVHVRGGTNGTSVANIGTADKRIGYFEAHTTWGKDDWGVSILQVNEGHTLNFFAVDALFDGSTHANGGVFGSGGWGTLNVDVSNKLTIDGNISASYGLMNSLEGKSFVLNIKAKELDMKGDINAGSQGAGYSNTNRTTILNLNVAKANVEGDVNVYGKSQSGFTGNLAVSGSLNASKDSEVLLGGAFLTDGSSQNQSSTISFNEGITATDQARLTVTQGSEVSTSNINAGESSVVTLEQSVLSINKDSSSIANLFSQNSQFYVMGEATATVSKLDGSLDVKIDQSSENKVVISEKTENSTVSTTGSASYNDQHASAEESLTQLVDSVSVSGGYVDNLYVEEADVNGAATANVGKDGNLTNVRVKENTKLASFRGLNATALVAWRDEVAYTNQRMEFLRDNSHAYGAWAQVYGGESKYEDKAELTTTTVQVGADMTIGDWVAGAAFSYMTGEADLLRGDADTDAYTLSLYAERNFDSGLFVNGLARYGRLSTDATAGNMDASYDNNAFSLGGNVGYRFTFAEQAFVEPNFGLQYAYVMGDDYKASNGVKVEQDDFDALIASLGARVGFNFPNNAGKLFARASVNHDFLGEIDGTAGNGKAVQDMYVDLGGTWVTYGVGTQFNITDNLSVWGNVDRTTGGEVSTNYMMNAGLRYVF